MGRFLGAEDGRSSNPGAAGPGSAEGLRGSMLSCGRAVSELPCLSGTPTQAVRGCAAFPARPVCAEATSTFAAIRSAEPRLPRMWL